MPGPVGDRCVVALGGAGGRDEAMEQVTLFLYDLAFEAGGDYDGWETRIVA